MTPPRRREFLKTTLATAAGPALAARRFSPNHTVRVAVVGLRGRGRALVDSFFQLAKDNVEIAALCDCDASVLAERAADFEKRSGKKVRTYPDMRRVFDDRSIHAVGFATPNHWHALGTVWACQAGQDVYVEKPGSHTIWEGRQVLEAAKKYGRIVQHGTQNRSSPNIVEGVRKLKEGVIGRVYLARGVAYKKRGSIGRIVEEAVPQGLNWDASTTSGRAATCWSASRPAAATPTPKRAWASSIPSWISATWSG